MLHTLAFLMALPLAPAQSGGLTVSHVRPLYSPLGPERVSDKILPGDIYFVGFTTDGMTVQQDGRVNYSIGMELSDSTGKSVSKQAPRELATVQSLGGSELQMYATVLAGADQSPGQYSMKVTIQDLQGKKSTSFTRKFQILKPRFGIIRFRPTLDPNGLIPAPTVGVPGQVVFLSFWVVGFQRGTDRQPSVTAEVQIYDEDGKATIQKPPALRNQPLEADQNVIPMSIGLSLNRLGKFKVVLRVVDNTSSNKKPYEISYPITVVPNK
jgi:hypothetical protein